MIIVSPYARAGFTDSTVASYSSTLSFIEHNWGLQPLARGDANAYDLSGAFDFSQPPIAPVQMVYRPLPAWEQAWIAAHPPDPNDIT